MKAKFKKGDVIYFTKQPYVTRVIYAVFKNHYEWKYEFSEEIFDSRNSSDPLLINWKLK